MAQVDQKRAFNKLKHELEPFRAILVQVNSLLTWQQNYYPGVIFGVVTFIYILLWSLELSLITLFSVSALLCVLFDFVLPSISRLLFCPDKWNGEQEAAFEEVCNHVLGLKTTVCGWYDFMFNERKSTMFVTLVSTVLLAMAWLGAVINNLLLMYVLTLCLVLTPGILNKKLLSLATEQCGKVINTKMNQLRNKKKDE